MYTNIFPFTFFATSNNECVRYVVFHVNSCWNYDTSKCKAFIIHKNSRVHICGRVLLDLLFHFLFSFLFDFHLHLNLLVFPSYLPFSEVQRLNENKQATLTFWQMVQNSRSIDMMYSNVPSHSNIFNKLRVLVFVFVYKYFLIISRTKIRTENFKETEYGRIQETKEGQRKKTAEQWGIPIMIRFDSELWSVMIADSVFSDFIL